MSVIRWHQVVMNRLKRKLLKLLWARLFLSKFLQLVPDIDESPLFS